LDLGSRKLVLQCFTGPKPQFPVNAGCRDKIAQQYMAIRRPDYSEYPAIRDLILTVVTEIYGDLWDTSAMPNGDEDWSTSWIAVVGTHVIGVLLTTNDWIDDLWIRRSQRGRGPGNRKHACRSLTPGSQVKLTALRRHSGLRTSLTQRRHFDREYVEPVKQILAKCASHDCLFQVTICRCNNANVNLQRLIGAYALKFSLLKHPQQRNLRFQWQITDLIEKDGAPISRFEATQTPLCRACERALFVPKQL